MTPGSLHSTEAEIQAEMLDVLASLGWDVRSRAEMTALRGRGRMNEAIVEPLLVEAILRLNEGLSDDEAQQIAAQVRRISSDREMLAVLRSGVPHKPAPNVDTRDIRIVDLVDPERNSYIATEELSITTGGARNPRLDVVLFINGLPLGMIENKATTEPVSAAAADWSGYWRDVPQLVAQASVVGCCNGTAFLVGPSGMQSADDYIEWTDPWPHSVEDPDDPLLVALTGAFSPHALLDLAASFVVFETRDGRTRKKLARAHQYRAANKLVERVVDGRLDRGIVWHATGSGKSLTMVFAARKLLRAGLGNPTVLLVIDRTELDEQISETLLACEFDGVQAATTRRRLRELLEADAGGVIITTVQKFDDDMAGALASGRVIAFVDEAHRTQFGRFGIWMRAALPNAMLFGFTGTPIEMEARSTRAAFSPRMEDGQFEPYLDRYSFDQAIADGATVPVAYEPRLPEWNLTGTDLDAHFEEVAGDLSEEDRERIRSEATRESVIAKASDRVSAVAADVAQQLRERIAPNGFGAQLVATDREACALYGEALSAHLEPDEFAVIMSRHKKDATPLPGGVDLRRWHPAAQWERVHGRLPDGDAPPEEDEEPGEEFVSPSDRAAIRDFIARFKSDSDPLKLLIVNGMLITGFDAPIEQGLFLDRALRGHSLIQAIARTNRRYPAKDSGLILDYWGVFSELEEALKEFASEDLAGLAEDTESLYDRFPGLLESAFEMVAGAPSTGSARRRMLWIVRRFIDHPDEAERFEGLVRASQSLFETLAPDPRLAPHLGRYAELMQVWLSYQSGVRRGRPDLSDLRAKTAKLVQESIGVEGIRGDLTPQLIDAEFLAALSSDEELSPEEKATDIEAAVVHEIKVRGEDDPLARTLQERLDRLRSRQEREAQMTLEGLREWEELAKEHLSARDEASSLGLDGPSAVAWQALRLELPEVDPDALVPVATRIGERFSEIAGFTGWPERSDVLQGLRKAILNEIAGDPLTRPLALQRRVPEEIIAGLVAAAR